MIANRLVTIYSMMERHDRSGAGGLSLCPVAAELTGVDGAGIALATDGQGVTSLCTSGRLAHQLMELEMALGDGPAADVARTGEVTGEADLRAPAYARWPLYVPEALAVGALAVFGFPVRIGAVRFGALTLCRESPGELSTEQRVDAGLMASVVARAVLAMRAGSPDGSLLEELRGGPELDFRVHQAAGMLAVQGSTSVRDALVALRARAYASGTELSTLAHRVVTRQTSLHPETRVWVDRRGNPT
ncbi:MAG: GAF domain-containing protein [Acidimicrobiales bacterium]